MQEYNFKPYFTERKHDINVISVETKNDLNGFGNIVNDIKSNIENIIEEIKQTYPNCKIKCRYIKSIDTYEFYYGNKKYIDNTEFKDLFYSVSKRYLYDNGIKNYCFNYRNVK